MTADADPVAPDHPWAGDDEGHNCATCIEHDDHFNKCDRLAHPISSGYDLLTAEQQATLADSLKEDQRARRQGLASVATIPLAGLAPAPQAEPLRAALERLRPKGEAVYVLWSDIEAALQASQPESPDRWADLPRCPYCNEKGTHAPQCDAPQVEPLRAALERLVNAVKRYAENDYTGQSGVPLDNALLYAEKALQASPPPESRAVELLRELVSAADAEPDAGDLEWHYGGLMNVAEKARAFLKESGAVPASGEGAGE